MTTLMERALKAVSAWPRDRQDEAAELLLALDRLGPAPYQASADELAAVDEASSKRRAASGPVPPR
jgi:hypothetical protein